MCHLFCCISSMFLCDYFSCLLFLFTFCYVSVALLHSLYSGSLNRGTEGFIAGVLFSMCHRVICSSVELSNGKFVLWKIIVFSSCFFISSKKFPAFYFLCRAVKQLLFVHKLVYQFTPLCQKGNSALS